MNRYREKAAPLGFGISLDIVDPVMADFISKKTIRLREAYGLRYEPKELAAIQQKIRNQVLQGCLDGHPVRTVAERLMNVLSDLVEITIKQAILIAGTELIGAANYSRYVSITNSGFQEKQWFTARDEEVRPLHKEIDGKTVAVGGLWVFSDGNALRYPGDDLGPDHLVVGCRCIEVVVPGTHHLQSDTWAPPKKTEDCPRQGG